MSPSTRFGRGNYGAQVDRNLGSITNNNFGSHSSHGELGNLCLSRHYWTDCEPCSDRDNIRPLASYLSSPVLPYPRRGHAHIKIFNVYGDVSHFASIRVRRGPRMLMMAGLPSLEKGRTGELVPDVYRPALKQFSGYVILSDGRKYEFERARLRNHRNGSRDLCDGNLPEKW